MLVAIGSLATASCGQPAPGDELTVFAASSLEPALSRWEPHVEESLDAAVSFSFSSSSLAARQVVEGAPADVLLTADQEAMSIAAVESAVEDPSVFAVNRLTLVVEKGNPESIRSLRDLGRPELNVVLCDPDVPCGRLAADLLAESGVEPAVDSLEENVRAAVGKVVLGEADATVAYATDIRSRRDELEEVDVDDSPATEYMGAVVSRSGSKSAARRFLDLLRGASGRRALRESGFELPLVARR